MKFYNTFKSGSGYKTTEWSENEMLNYNIVMLVIYCILLGVFSIIASPILIFVTLHDIEDEGVKPSIWGEHGLYVCTNLNIAYLVVHLFLIIFSATVYYNVVDKTKRMSTLVVATLIVFFISFGIASGVNTYNETPKHIETQEEKDMRVSRGDFKNEEERKEYFDRLERRWGN